MCNNNYYYVIGHIPIVPLNFTVISNEGPFSRDSVELCVREILLSMSRCLFEKKTVQLDFYKVGRLFTQNSKIKMKFFRDFIKKLDFNGELESIFRPRTAQSELSIMTNPFLSRPTTSANPSILPR